MPQGSVLGPLLCIIFMNDIFWFANHTKICNYVHDTAIFACHSDFGIVLRQLDDCSVTVTWFSNNLLKINDEKCHFMVFGDKNIEIIIKIGNSEIKESDYEKLLGITFDKKLNFIRFTLNT